jgi:hypothetical protein
MPAPSRLEKKPIPIHCAHSPERSEPDDAAVLNLNPVNIANKNNEKQQKRRRKNSWFSDKGVSGYQTLVVA